MAGATIVAQHTGQPLPFPVPPFGVAWHSPNTEMQRCAIWLKAYPPGHKLHRQAVDRAIASLDYQELHGHQKLKNANEFNTDGHWPHWCRGMAALHMTALEQGEEGIVERCLRWWGRDFWMMLETMCPRVTPRHEPRVVGLGARFEGGNREERDIGYGLLVVRLARQLKGPRFWRNAEVRQDLFGLHLLRLLVERGAFAGLRAIEPVTAGPYEIQRLENGHVTRGSGFTGQPAAPPVCWVRYRDGEIGTTEPPPDLGRELGRHTLQTATINEGGA